VRQEETIEKTLPASGVRKLEARVRFGGVRLTADSPEGIVIKAVRQVDAGTPEAADSLIRECRLDVENRGDTIILSDFVPPIEGFLLRPGGVRLNLEVRVPAGLSVSVALGAGNAEMSGAFAEARAKVGAGNVQLTEASASGDVRLKTGAGDVRVKDLSCSGPTLSARTGAGNVSVSLEALPTQTVEAGAGAGNVSVEIPVDAHAAVTLKTGVGNASSDFEGVKSDGGGFLSRSLAGELGGGGTTVTLKTGVGNVELRAAPQNPS
jgi:hypothetical protein